MNFTLCSFKRSEINNAGINGKMIIKGKGTNTINNITNTAIERSFASCGINKLIKS